MTGGATRMALRERDRVLEYGDSEHVHMGAPVSSPLIREPEKQNHVFLGKEGKLYVVMINIWTVAPTDLVF